MKDPFDSSTRELHGMPPALPAFATRHRSRPLRWVEDLGYQFPRDLEGVGVCGVRSMLFTAAIVVGISDERYVGRYCYETMGAAIAALAIWDGQGDPPGEWIKYRGHSGERLGPGCALARAN